MKKKLLPKLPAIIKVKVAETPSGKYIADLPEYDVFTEVDTLGELEFYVNDLIYAFFDVPKKFQGKIWYQPIKRTKRDLLKIDAPLAYKAFLTQEVFNKYRFLS